MNTTYAIWCNKINKESKSSIDIHLNLWKLKRKKSLKHDYFLDFGLKVDDLNNLAELKLFLPFELKKESITDLGRLLINNHKLVNGIFNEDYTSNNDNTPKQLKIINKNGDLQFTIYCLDESNGDFTLDQKYNGTLVTLNIKKIQNRNVGPYYFRFRINSSKLNNLVSKHRSASSLFESAFTNTEVIDFRLNEKRTYNESMSEDIIQEGEYFIEKVHFLLLTNSSDDLILNEYTPSCRQLEKGLWESYIPVGYRLDNIVAYHWKKKKNDTMGVESFNSLIKLKILKSNYLTIIIYLSIFGTLTVVFNIISAIIQKSFGV